MSAIRIISAIVITLAIYVISGTLSMIIKTGNSFIPSIFILHVTMALLSATLIWALTKRSFMSFPLKSLRFKDAITSIGITVAFIIPANLLLTLIYKIFSVPFLPDEKHFVFATMNPLQILLFVAIIASIAEELLFRGFLVNYLSFLSDISLPFLKTRLALPVLISGVAFGLAHFSLVSTGASTAFIVRIVINTIILGICAGYFQNKHKTFYAALLLHITFNMQGFIGSLLI